MLFFLEEYKNTIKFHFLKTLKKLKYQQLIYKFPAVFFGVVNFFLEFSLCNKAYKT